MALPDSPGPLHQAPLSRAIACPIRGGRELLSFHGRTRGWSGPDSGLTAITRFGPTGMSKLRAVRRIGLRNSECREIARVDPPVIPPRPGEPERRPDLIGESSSEVSGTRQTSPPPDGLAASRESLRVLTAGLNPGACLLGQNPTIPVLSSLHVAGTGRGGIGLLFVIAGGLMGLVAAPHLSCPTPEPAAPPAGSGLAQNSVSIREHFDRGEELGCLVPRPFAQVEGLARRQRRRNGKGEKGFGRPLRAAPFSPHAPDPSHSP
jgi:hypothetical protein